MTYRADIDGIRAVAVLLVLVFHFDLFTLGKAGFIGVDVFFVISGFLITSLIRQDLEKQTFHFGRFVYRRIRRLYPALLATLLLTLIAAWFLFLPHRFEELAAETILTLLYIVNFYFWQNVNYFGLLAADVPLLHMWSLAVEEQFYLIFPLFCLLFWRWNSKILVPIVGLGLLISFSLNLYFTPLKPELSFYLLPTRAWELLIGSVVALAVHDRRMKGTWLLAMSPLGLALIAVSIFLYSPITQIPGWYALLPTTGAAMLIVGGYAVQAPITRLLASAPVVWIGKVSYPLYLVHWPIKIFLQEHSFEFTLELRLLGFALSFLIAAAIFYLIESPVRQGKVLSRAGPYLGGVIGLSLTMIVSCVLIIRSDGVAVRFVPKVSEVLAFKEDSSKEYLACGGLRSSIQEMCAIGKEEAPREVLVIGDSHAYALSGALDLWLDSTGRGGVLSFVHACMPIIAAGGPTCQQTLENNLKLIESTPEVREVILVSIWRQGLPNRGKRFGDRWVPKNEVEEVFTEQLIKTVFRLRKAGKQVTIVEPLFAAAASVPETLAANLAYGRNWPVDTSLADHKATFAPFFRALEAIESGHVRRISLTEPLCPNQICKAVIDGKPLFTDNNHLAFSHSNLVAEFLKEVDRDRE
ncbi:MAG: acyltransferase family protein [Pseudomonadota bacterium]